MEKNHICIARKCYFSSGVNRELITDSGFNYTFEVFVYGPIDPVTGLVINLTDVNIALSSITKLVDQKHLNYDLKLSSVLLVDIHEFIHNLFNIKFNEIAPDNIYFLKSKLSEGEFESSEILTSKGNKVFS